MATRNNRSQVKSTSLTPETLSKLSVSKLLTNRQSDNLNITTFSIKAEPLWDESNQIYEPFPISLLDKDQLKHEHKSIFKMISETFSNYPHYIINALFKKDSLYNKLIGNRIYTTAIPDKIYTRNNPNFSHESYESEYTLRVGETIGNGILIPTAVESVKQTIRDFLKSEKRIYYGFIKLGPKINASILKKLFSVGGHMNSFIIDKEIKRIIHFEPKGAFSMISIWKDIDLVEYLNEIVGDDSLKNYELIKTTTTSFSFKTPQFFDIYCQTYSIYAILLYCFNIGFINKGYEPEKFILQLFSKMSKEKAIIFQNYFYCILYKKLGGEFDHEIDFDCGIFDDLVPRNNNSNRAMPAAEASKPLKGPAVSASKPLKASASKPLKASASKSLKAPVPPSDDSNNFEMVGGSKKRTKKKYQTKKRR